MELKRVVITGLGAITPIGNNVADFWAALCSGSNGAGKITRFDCEKFKVHIACEVKNFNPLDHFEYKESRKLDLYSQFGIVAASEAVEDSGINQDNADLDEVGVIFASGIGGLTSFNNEVSDFGRGDGTPHFSPFVIPKLLPDIAAGHISMKYGFRGVNYGIVAACASSAIAIADAFNYIRFGKASVIVTGGSEAAVCEAGIGGFEAMKALCSTHNDDPLTASRPFDAERAGFVMGEGAGALVIEELEHALARGAKIYGEIIGVGFSGDAYHITAPHPEGIGARLSMQRAIDDAKISLEDVGHINTHGTSTPMGDASEVLAIKQVFGDYAPKIAINSIKSMTGHLLGGAGAIEAIATALTIKNDIVPPTINHFTDDPAFEGLDFTFGKAKERHLDYAISNAFGFGGHNVSIVFKRY